MSSVLTPSIQEAFSLVMEPLQEVKKSLLALAPPDSAVLEETVRQSMTGGGKYMRPVITLLSGLASRPSELKDAPGEPSRGLQMIEVAAVTEMIHVGHPVPR